MEIVVTARHTQVSDRFRRHVEDKLSKVEQLAPRAQRLDVEITHEANPRQSSRSERVEITVRAKGPVIRAEASADDLYAALDVAQEKLVERLRRAKERKKSHYKRAPGVPAAALSDGKVEPPAEQPTQGEGDQGDQYEYSPVLIREKSHAAVPMTLDDALYEMELVGHDFYLFIDSATNQPSVVYRRRGWSYGVIRLDSSAQSLQDAV